MVFSFKRPQVQRYYPRQWIRGTLYLDVKHNATIVHEVEVSPTYHYKMGFHVCWSAR